MRYSTDGEWLVPHFEKMLYDNAQLISLLCQVWKQTGSELYKTRVFETVAWLLREMEAENGAFAAAWDADSEGEEGLFYTWTKAEIDGLLDPETAKRFDRVYDVRANGNWEGRTILHRNHPQGGEDGDLDQAKALLLAHRSKRIWPGRDHKVLADWNGMVIAALAEAAFTFHQPQWLAAAQTAFAVISAAMSRPGGRLAHSLCQGKAAHAGVLDDYAHMALAALTLFDVTGHRDMLAHAAQWLDSAHAHHWNQEAGGYFLSADDTTDIITRTKPCFDSAVPSGNGVMAEALARMVLASGEAKWRDRAEAVLAAFSAAIADQLPNMTTLLDAFEILADPLEVTLTGTGPKTEALLEILAQSSRQIHSLKREESGESSALICRASVCSAPIGDPDRLRDALSAG